MTLKGGETDLVDNLVLKQISYPPRRNPRHLARLIFAHRHPAKPSLKVDLDAQALRHLLHAICRTCRFPAPTINIARPVFLLMAMATAGMLRLTPGSLSAHLANLFDLIRISQVAGTHNRSLDTIDSVVFGIVKAVILGLTGLQHTQKRLAINRLVDIATGSLVVTAGTLLDAISDTQDGIQLLIASDTLPDGQGYHYYYHGYSYSQERTTVVLRLGLNKVVIWLAFTSLDIDGKVIVAPSLRHPPLLVCVFIHSNHKLIRL